MSAAVGQRDADDAGAGREAGGAMPGAWRRGRAGSLVRFGAAIVVLAVLAALAVAAPGFATGGNIANVVEQSTVLALLAFGMTIVIVGGGADVIRGGIDLSLAANLGLCDAVYTLASGAGGQASLHADAVAAVLTLGTGATVGLVNGIAVVGFGILPLLATLTVMNVCAGLELVLTQNTVLTTSSPLLGFIAGAGAWGLSATDWILLGVSLLAAILFHATPAGLRLRAVGGHREAARAIGLSVRRTIAASYVVAGLLAATAAIVQAARLSGSSPGSGDILLSVVLTSLMSAVFSRRLEPSIGGTLASVLFIGCLINGFQLLNVSSDWVNAVQGMLILSVVAVRAGAR